MNAKADRGVPAWLSQLAPSPQRAWRRQGRDAARWDDPAEPAQQDPRPKEDDDEGDDENAERRLCQSAKDDRSAAVGGAGIQPAPVEEVERYSAGETIDAAHRLS
jgi:hypothetical protein